MCNSVKDKSWDSDRPSTSSSSITSGLCAVTNSTSGWRDLVEFYQAEASESTSTRKRIWGDGIPVPAHIEISKASQSGHTVVCPICDYRVVSKYSQTTVYTLTRYSRHLKVHEGELSNSSKTACDLCYNFYSRSKIGEHYRICHKENFDNYAASDSYQFTNSTERYKDAINFEAMDFPLEQCSRLPGETLFTSCSTKKSLEYCRAIWTEKFRRTSDPQFLFIFKMMQNSSLPFAWICPLCDHSITSSGSHSFSNDISLRLFVLRHFSTKHRNEDGITSLLSREWEIVDEELGFKVSYHVQANSSLLQQTQRSCHFYVLSLSRPDTNTLLQEMIRRNANNEEENSCAFVVCAVCLNPVRRSSLFRHFSSVGHRYLEAHAEYGEFREVAEIAESPTLTFENFAFASLRFSRTYRIKELGDTQSMTFLKWRCTLSCEVSGHVDDVVEFPTVSALKIHALKHFQTYHNEFFEQDFLNYEWDLLRAEHSCFGEIRSYSPLKWNFDGEPFDTTNPNHFKLPYRGCLFSKPIMDMQICGFCFYCGYASQFLSHIICHGYVDIGVLLNNGSIELPCAPGPSQEVVRANIADIEVPNEILGPVGRESRLRSCVDRGRSTPLLQVDSSIGEWEDDCMGFPNEKPGTASTAAASSGRTGSKLSSKVTALYESEDVASSTSLDNDQSETNSLNDLSICNDTLVERQEHLQTEYSRNVLTTTCVSNNASAVDPALVASTTTEVNMDSTAYTEQNSGHSVEEHKAFIQRKFTWEGPPPPAMDVEQSEQLQMLSRNECPFCTTVHGSRGLRVPAFANDEIKEESMIAHIVRFHHDDIRAIWVLNAKRYRLSVSTLINPLKYLLEPTQEGFLICSSCEKASFPKLANLRAHWVRCVEVCGRYRKDLRWGKYVLESPSMLAKPPRQRSRHPPVKCPVPECISSWRPSFVYPNAIGQVSHILSRHLISKEAYDLALQLGNSEKLEERFPFLNVAKSFANTLDHPKTLCLQCSKCEHGFQRPNELVQHAKRYHPTEQHYSGAPKCPLKCNKKLRRLVSMSDEVLRLLHVFRFHLGSKEAVSYVRNWPEKYDTVMENEPVYKFDVLESLERSLVDSPCIKCTFCSELIPIAKYLVKHRRPGAACYNENSELISNRNGNRIIASASKKAIAADSAHKPSGETTISHSAAKRRKMRHCSYCSRAVPLSSCYSDDVSKILHVVHAHLQNKLAVKWLRSRDYYKFIEEFPYLDIVATLESSLSSGKSALHCAVCNFETDTSSRLVHHARLHDELLNKKGSPLDPCVECGEVVLACSLVNNGFQQLCHVLIRHRDNSEAVLTAVKSYENGLGENDIMLLNVQRSLEMQSDGRSRLVCSKCEFICYNGYALIEHFKLHEPNNAKKPVRELRREPPVVCVYCNRMLVCSTRYTPRVTLLTHFIKFHRLCEENVNDFIGKCECWKVSCEFPFIDAALSIKQGKLQCALCESTLPDVAQMLKHATIVHEEYRHRPILSNEDTILEGTTILDRSNTSKCSSSSKDGKILSSICKTQIITDLSSPSLTYLTNQPRTTNSSVDFDLNGKETKASQILYTPKKDGSLKTQRKSRSYAPANDRTPELPTSDRDFNKKSCIEQLAQQVDNVRSTKMTMEEVHSSKGHNFELAEERSSKTILSTDAAPHDLPHIESASASVPATSSSKLQKPFQVTSAKSSILSWLSPIRRSVLPQRRAELAINHSQSLGNLRDALIDSPTTLNANAAKNTSANVSEEGTLFDELPQRVVRKMAAPTNPPEDISHIKGAKGFSCNFCTFKGRTICDIRRHTSIVHSEVLPSLSTNIISPCHLCSEVFQKRSLLLKHITDNHMNVQNPFRCAYCPKQYATARTVREHERRVHESRLFLDAANMICPYCDKQFDNKRNRDEHVRRHRSIDGSTSRGF